MLASASAKSLSALKTACSRIQNVSRALAIAAAAFLLSACFSLPNINLFGDDDAENKADGNRSGSFKRELSAEEQARRDALVEGKTSRPTLASLDLQPVRVEELAIPELSLSEKRNEYEALLPLIKDPIQKQQVAFRLADIKMLIAEQNQQEGVNKTAEQGVFDDAISDYQSVLAQHEIVAPQPGVALTPEQQALNRKQMDAMYQLTRALDLSAKPEESLRVAKKFLATFSIEQFDITPYHVELYFRMGEYYFNRQQYASAVDYYQQVVEYGKGSSESQRQKINFYAISAYMLGWSHFKLDNYAQAMDAFGAMLDASLYGINNIQQISIKDLPIAKGELRLVKDATRIMALTFSYQGNAEAIQEFYTGFGARDYEQLIYDELAQQHLDNDRFQDSATVLVTFANKNPTHPRAIEFYIRHIDAYLLGEFPAKVLLAKEDFVRTYSLGAGVVVNMNTPIGRDARPYLRDYIKQLAQTEHSIAQGIESILARRQQASTNKQQSSANEGFVGHQISQEQSQAWRLANDRDLTNLSRQAYTKAKEYYQNFIRTFEPDPEVPELRFYLGEALFALEEYEHAIIAFETYAYIDAPVPKAVEAAYAALLAYEMLPPLSTQASALAQQSTMKYVRSLSKKQKSQAKFADTFKQDARAPMVALTLMQDLFEQQNYIPAQEWAAWLLSIGSKGSNEDASVASLDTAIITNTMQESAKLVMAHSYFAMQNFAQAEIGYRQLLRELPEEDERKKGIVDLLAASLYKQAETLLVDAKLDTASLQALNINNKSQLTPMQLRTLQQGVALLQDVVTDTPLSEFRLAAQYDSAVYFALLENWPEAIDTFIDFKKRFPHHPLSRGINEQLFYAYEQTQDWPKAAKLLMAKFQRAPNTETGRLALYKAAEYYEKAGDRTQSLIAFRLYAHDYPVPLADANEARFTLSEYYLESGNETKRRFWLNKLVQTQVDIQANSPELSTPRSVYLASMAAMVFASNADRAFTYIKLTQPLDKSLQKKQKALQKAIYEYDRVMSFGSAEHVTAANYQLANLYTTLADDLLNSDRPNGLSALELGQYEILLEEQAYPFEETAIDLHVNNISRVQSGLYDDWIKQSYSALKSVMPGRYNKPEVIEEVVADDF